MYTNLGLLGERAGNTAMPVDSLPSWLWALADPIRLHILQALSELGDATASDLTDLGTASNQTLRRHLEALVNFGVLQRRPGESDGETAGRPPARFSLRPEIRDSVRLVFKAFAAQPQPSLR
jgi:predicted ArsR family transcriptional regulator